MRLHVFLLVGLLSSCSSISTLDVVGQRRGAYDSYLNKNLKIDRLYLKLRETAVARAMRITAESAELQSKVVPGFEKLPIEGKEIFVVSMEMLDWSRFSISDFKFYLGDQLANSVREIMDQQLLNTLYPFAIPHDRAFMVEFEKGPSSVLRVQTSQGQFQFNFGEG